MKKFFHIFILSSLLLSGCYDDLRDHEQNRLAELRDVRIASLEQQAQEIISSVNDLSKLGSEIEIYIANLQKVNDELKANLTAVNAGFESTKDELLSQGDESSALVVAEFENVQAALEAKIADIEAVISSLQTKKASIDAKVEMIRQHADTDFAAQDWVEATLATFESQQALQNDVAGIKAYVDALSESLISVENEINGILEGKLAGISASLEESLQNEADRLAAKYKTIVSSVKEEVTNAFTEALASAISNSENKLKTWVSEQLTDYWTVAEAKAKLEAFYTLVGNVPDGKDVQSQIEELLCAIAGTETELTEAYTAAIKAAIEKSDSEMSRAIVDRINEVKDVVSGLSVRVDQLESEVVSIWTRIDELVISINSVSEQIIAINTSISVLTELGLTLEEYIESIRQKFYEADEDNADIVNSLVEALDTEVGSLQKQLDALKEYIGTIPDDADNVVDWVKASQKSVEEQLALYSAIDRISAIKSEIENEIEAAGISISGLGSAIDSKIQDSKSTIDAWIDAHLTTYHTVAGTDAAFNRLRISLKALIDTEDSAIEELIEGLGIQLSNAVGQFEKDYEAAVKKAIEDNAGVVTSAISGPVDEAAGKVSDLKDRLDQLDNDVAQIKQDLSSIKSDVNQMNNDIAAIRNFVNESGFVSLQAIVDYLSGELEKCASSYATISQLTALKEVVYGNGTTTFGLKGEVDKLTGLTSRLAAAESAAAGLITFLTGYTGSDSLAAIIAGINADIVSLQKDVFGDSSTNTDSIQTVIENMLKALYGDTMSPETASATSIFGRISALSKKLIYNNFSTLEFVPSDENGCIIVKNNSTWDISLDFIIRPAGLASLLNSDNCKLYVLSAATREVDGLVELEMTVSSADPETGEFTVHGEVDNGGGAVKPNFSAGYAVLYIDAQDGDEKLSFTSKYIPLKVEMN